MTAPDLFDASFFKISYAEARVMDMQHRLLLEHTYCAMHNSGANQKELHGRAIGIYIGIWAEAGWNDVLNQSAHTHSAFRISAASCSMAASLLSAKVAKARNAERLHKSGNW